VLLESKPISKQWDFSAPLQLRLRSSWQLAGVLLASHGGAAVCLLMTSLPAWATWLSVPAVIGHLLYALGQHAFRCTDAAITEITVVDDLEVDLVSGHGQRSAAVLLGAYSHPLFSVLRLRLGPWRHRSLVLFPDMVEIDRLRELRVRLRRLGSIAKRSRG
jgi:hypothetical protein